MAMDDEYTTLDFIKQLLLDDIEIIPSSSSHPPDPLLDIDLGDCFLSDFDTLDYWSPSNVSCSPSDTSSSETSVFDTTSAAKAYDRAAFNIRGRKAILNFPLEIGENLSENVCNTVVKSSRKRSRSTTNNVAVKKERTNKINNA
nr:hypothetical protein [Tanacetum cinerariifolium]